MITAVLDSNVLLSGFVSEQSVPGRLLLAWHNNRFKLIVSEPIIGEVARTFEDRYFRRRLTAEEIAAYLSLLAGGALVVLVTDLVRGAASHPEDDLVLATATSAQAAFLVTGDKQLQRLGTYRGVTILSPREFLDVLAEQERRAP